LSDPDPPPRELEDLKKALNANAKIVNIRLREGEYQFSLAKAIASFERELRFPNVKEIIEKLYGERRTEEQQFVQKIQTILKKMEKSGIVRILPKTRPWELQRYALTSFKFQDAEKNLIILATEDEIRKALKLSRSEPSVEHRSRLRLNRRRIMISLLAITTISLYAVILWTLIQTVVNETIFVLTFLVAVICSITLGILVSRNK
jgi:K+-sensing histidine kinase KdpD